MAQITVEILSDNTPRYSPSNEVKHGDSVVFTVDGDRTVTVSFDAGSCLINGGPFTLQGGTTAASTSPQYVSPFAARRAYTFTVDDAKDSVSTAQKLGGNLEAKQGELDVTTDPPKDI